MHRAGIQPQPQEPPVDFPLVDVEAFSQVPLEERWQLMAGALNRLAAMEARVEKQVLEMSVLRARASVCTEETQALIDKVKALEKQVANLEVIQSASGGE